MTSRFSFFTKLIIAIVLIFTATISNAQKTKFNSGSAKPAFEKGSKTLGIFIGAGVEYGYYGNYSQLPAIGIIYDHGIINNVGPGTIGIGGVIGFKSAWYKYSGGERATWTNYFIGARGTYHLTILKDKNNKFDPYAGVTAGFRIYDYNDSYYGGRANPYGYNSVYPVFGFFVGAKYNFSKNFGAFAELGYDISFFRIGLNANF